MVKITRLLLIVFYICMIFFAPAAEAVVEIQGAGASFPYPLYTRMFESYSKDNGVKINYQSIGSGGGIRQVFAQTVDFGASDAFLSKEQMKKENNEIIHIPMCIGAVAIVYNVPGVKMSMRLTQKALVGIFLGKIQYWDHPEIARYNKEAVLPHIRIIPVRRSDGSGTTAIFTNYLSKIDSEWKKKVGQGVSVKWPTGLGAKTNAGVAGLVAKLPGSIGYVELIYALSNNLTVAKLKNKNGLYLEPTLESTMKSAEVKIPADTRVMLTDTLVKDGYPITGFTWLLVYKEQFYNRRTRQKAKALVKMLWWMTHEGQKYVKPMHYAPLTNDAVREAEKMIKMITYNGVALL